MHVQFQTRRTAIAAVLSATLGLGGLMTMGAAHAAGAWVNTATQAIPLQNISGALPIAPERQLHIVVGLKARNKAQLDALVAQIGNPASPQFGKVLTPAQVRAAYSPTASQADAVVSYLRNAGFSNIEVGDSRLIVSAYASAADVQRAFNTELVSFNLQGRSLFANRTPAQVPVALNGIVAAVVGLENLSQMRTNLERAATPAAGTSASVCDTIGSLPGGLPVNPLCLNPLSGPQYQVAYDAGTTPTGWGTTIGIITEGDLTQVTKDLRQYEAEYHLPQVPYEIVPVGLQTSDAAGVGEWDLDSQSSSGIAGNLRKIIFYNGGSLWDVDLIPAYEKAVSENRAKAVNMSFGGCEALEYLNGGMLIADLVYEQGAAQGMTFFASAGDGGASCQLLVNAGQPMVVGETEYPSVSPYVVAVGGTSLLVNSDYSYNAETVWPSTGGGISANEFSPPWQIGVAAPGATTVGRVVPDVAMVGDPNIGGAAVVLNGEDTGIGGTSLSSPLSVGVWARMQTAHGNCYGFAAPILYNSFGQPFGTAALDFHDILIGSNFLYPATPGWDFTTGLGTFDIAATNAGLPAVSCVPQAPESLGGGAVNGQVLLSWGGSPGATGYAVYEGTSAGGEGATPVATTANTSAVISAVSGGKTYYFTVKALNASGSSAASNELSVTVPVPPAPPVAPASSGAAAQTAKGSIKVYWKASPGATGYQVFQGTAAGAEGATPVASGVTSTYKIVTGLASGTKYYFYVKAVNANGASEKSPEASATAN